MPRALLRRMWLAVRRPLLQLRAVARTATSDSGDVHRILVIRQDRMGDVVLTSALTPPLKTLFPEAEIIYWIREPFLPLFERATDFSATAERPQGPFDLVIDPVLDYPLAPARTAVSFRSRYTAGFDVAGRGALFSIPVDPPEQDELFLASMARLLRPFGWQGEVMPPHLSVTDSERQAARQLAGEAPYMLIHPGAYYASQRWPAGHVAAVMDDVIRAGTNVVLIGGDADADVVDEVVQRSETKSAMVLHGSPLRTVMALMAEADVVLCNNSGPLHLATALGVATVSTLGPTNPAIWWPAGERQRVLEAPGCDHCERGDCERGCLARITPEQVLAAINTLLEEKA